MEIAQWKFPGLYKGDANKVSDEILSIGETATPEQILDKARDPDTELHKCFDWDDRVAAEKWRLQQARQIVCSLVYVPAPSRPASPPLRLMYKPIGTEGYKSTTLIMRNEDEYQRLLKTALRELAAFKAKYSMLTELEDVFKEIEKVTV